MRWLGPALAVSSLLGCSDPLGPAEAFHFRGAVAHAPLHADTVIVTVTAINVTVWTRTIVRDACPPLIDVHAYPAHTTRDAPAWRYLEYWSAGHFCLDEVPRFATAHVAPGDSLSYSSRLPVTAILGDSLPEGTFAFTALLYRLVGAPPGSAPELELGSLLLGAPAGSAAER